MDLGATICTSRSQECKKCPVNKTCKSAYEDINTQPKIKKERPKKKIFFTLAHSNDSFLLFKKNEKSFWESLWIPYDINGLKKNDIFKEPANKEVTNINHLLSHMELDITIEIVDYKTPFKVKTNLEYEWISKDQIHNYGLPKPIKTIIENHG
jgi:A/G-specific adenine glycosylase